LRLLRVMLLLLVSPEGIPEIVSGLRAKSAEVKTL